MSHTCCVSNCLTARNTMRGLTLALIAATVAFALVVIAPWHLVDAAAPAVTDDPLTSGQIVRPVPMALEQRTVKNGETDEVILKHWNFTDGFTPISDTF